MKELCVSRAHLGYKHCFNSSDQKEMLKNVVNFLRAALKREGKMSK